MSPNPMLRRRRQELTQELERRLREESRRLRAQRDLPGGFAERLHHALAAGPAPDAGAGTAPTLARPRGWIPVGRRRAWGSWAAAAVCVLAAVLGASKAARALQRGNAVTPPASAALVPPAAGAEGSAASALGWIAAAGRLLEAPRVQSEQFFSQADLELRLEAQRTWNDATRAARAAQGLLAHLPFPHSLRTDLARVLLPGSRGEAR